MKAIPYRLRKNAAPHPDSWLAINPADMPKIVLTDLHHELNEVYRLCSETDGWLWFNDPKFRDSYLRMMNELNEVCTLLMDEGCYPERATDKELLSLSYHLPPALALALLRKRLIRGLALRDMARARFAAQERTASPVVSEPLTDRLKSDRVAA